VKPNFALADREWAREKGTRRGRSRCSSEGSTSARDWKSFLVPGRKLSRESTPPGGGFTTHGSPAAPPRDDAVPGSGAFRRSFRLKILGDGPLAPMIREGRQQKTRASNGSAVALWTRSTPPWARAAFLIIAVSLV